GFVDCGVMLVSRQHSLPPFIVDLCIVFLKSTPTTKIYTLSLHDALPIFISKRRISGMALLILALLQRIFLMSSLMLLLVTTLERSEERFSRNAETDLVCRLLLEKKKESAHKHHALHVVLIHRDVH